MTSEPGLTITAPDRVLIHLKDNLCHDDDREFPQAITQKGISDATGMRLTHVPRTLKNLEDRKLVSSTKGHVAEERRRYKVYFLTESGLAEAKSILRFLENVVVSGTRVADILAGRRGPVLPVLMELAGEPVAAPKAERRLAGPIPPTEGFINRQHELEELGQMLEDPKNKLMVIYGSQGYGASALAAQFARESARKWSVAWVNMCKEIDELRKSLMDTLTEAVPGLEPGQATPKNIAQALNEKNIILVLDCYYEASEEVVEFLVGMVSAIKTTSGFKMLVTARENTPAYNRFYTIIDQHDGTVGEVHIRGLDIENCRTLLGTPDIDPDALKRLFLFTRGKPPTLKLLAKGNEKELRQHTSFSPEEINLMLFLKGQKST
ncbi:MAG: NB-ARC domain-containing protein [Thermoplasmata archaeon]